MHPRFSVAVHIFLLRGDAVLLVRRRNTGFEDGKLSVVAGHVEPGESVTRAALRETHEEVGVALSPDRLRVVGVMHRKSDEERIDFFLAYRLEGKDPEPENREPEKCSELLWADLAHLPDDTIPYVRTGIEKQKTKTSDVAYGFKSSAGNVARHDDLSVSTRLARTARAAAISASTAFGPGKSRFALRYQCRAFSRSPSSV